MGECVVCMDATVDSVFTACGHACACVQCCESLESCPMCRKVGPSVTLFIERPIGTVNETEPDKTEKILDNFFDSLSENEVVTDQVTNKKYKPGLMESSESGGPEPTSVVVRERSDAFQSETCVCCESAPPKYSVSRYRDGDVIMKHWAQWRAPPSHWKNKSIERTCPRVCSNCLKLLRKGGYLPNEEKPLRICSVCDKGPPDWLVACGCDRPYCFWSCKHCDDMHGFSRSPIHGCFCKGKPHIK